jgi:CheY-like chemotaxis protein
MLSVGKAFLLLEKKKPDIILINGEMAVTDEFDVAAKLKTRPEWSDIPLIILEKNFDPKTLPNIVEENTESEKGVS